MIEGSFSRKNCPYVMTVRYIVLACLASIATCQTRSPNIILMISDDQDVMLGSLRVMDNLKETIMQNGVEFSNAFTTTPICCPSRSSILTGLYAHNHNVLTNNDNCSSILWQRYFENRSYASYLHQHGYRTGYFGKYLNEYNGSYTPPGWDYWMGLVKNSKYYNYTLLHQGQRETHGNNYAEDYLTDLVTNRSVEFFKSSKVEDRERPVLAVVSFPAPHGPEDGAPQYAHLYGDDTGYKTESFDYVPNSDKHWIMRQKQHKMDENQLLFSQLLQQKRLQTLRSVDDGVKKIVDMLREIQELDNTYLIYVSDHGYHIGQFGLAKGKTMPYDFDIRIPFAIRGPGIPRNQTSYKIALNIDVAPTILGMAGLEIPEHMDGRNLLDIFSAERTAAQPWRDSFLIERGKATANKGNKTHLERPRMKSKSEKLQKICESPNHVYPCQPGQYWTCITGADHKLRLQKCKKPPKAKINVNQRRKNRCSCPPNRHAVNGRTGTTKDVNVQDYCGKNGFFTPNLKVPRPKNRNGNRLQKRMYTQAYTRDLVKRALSSYSKLRQERRYRRDSSARRNAGSGVSGHRPTRSMTLTSRCRLYMPNFEIRCRKDLYYDPVLWLKHMGHLTRSVKTMQFKMRYMKALQTCLEDYYSKKSSRPCECSQFSPKIRPPKTNISHPLVDESETEKREFDEKQKLFQKRREINKAKRQSKLVKLQRKKERLMRTGGEKRRCGYQGLTCFILGNRTWNSEPRWQGDSHCYCTNANNNTYWCVRIINEHTNALYCQFVTSFKEYFNLNEDPYQLISTEMNLQNEERTMYQAMIQRLRSCKGNANCTLPPFRYRFSNETRNNQTSSNVSSESTAPSLDFDVIAGMPTPAAVQVEPAVTPTAPVEPTDLLDGPSNRFDQPSVPPKGRSKGKSKNWARARVQKPKTKVRKPRRNRPGPHRQTDPFMMDGRGVAGMPGWGGNPQSPRKLRPDQRRRSRTRSNRRV